MQIKENIKAPHHWPLWNKFTGYRLHKGPVTRKMFPFDDVTTIKDSIKNYAQWKHWRPVDYPSNDQGPVSVYRCCLTSIQTSIMKIKPSHDRLICILEIPIRGKIVFIFKQGPLSVKMVSQWVYIGLLVGRNFCLDRAVLNIPGMTCPRLRDREHFTVPFAPSCQLTEIAVKGCFFLVNGDHDLCSHSARMTSWLRTITHWSLYRIICIFQAIFGHLLSWIKSLVFWFTFHRTPQGVCIH